MIADRLEEKTREELLSEIADLRRRLAACGGDSARGERAGNAVEAELVRARNAADEASRAKSEFLATMSHEIRTPLTVIMASIEHLLLSSADPPQKMLLEMADDSARRLHALIEDLLDFSRIEARRLEIRRENFDLRNCLRKTVELFRMQAQGKGLRLVSECSPEVPPVVHGDPDRLAQVLINLIGNAVKFTDGGEVLVTVDRRPGALLFGVLDTGIGIAESKRGRLFQSFSQLDGSLTRKYGGTGLGLAVSKALVELMGGTIWVESVEGKGSLFSFTVPLWNRRRSDAPLGDTQGTGLEEPGEPKA